VSDTYRISEVARKLGVARVTVDRALADGSLRLPVIEFRGVKRIPKGPVDRLVAEGNTNNETLGGQ
jgi:predicted site-specific integrase-resolvase